MPPFGAHLSIAGGLHNAGASAAALGCGALQVFTTSPSQWAGTPLTDADVTAFKTAAKAAKLKHLTAHDSYLINLAAPATSCGRSRSLPSPMSENRPTHSACVTS